MYKPPQVIQETKAWVAPEQKPLADNWDVDKDQKIE